jgi:hypothetical protein
MRLARHFCICVGVACVRRLEIRMISFLFCVLVVTLTQSSYFVYLLGDPGLRSDLRSHREVTFSFFPG